MDDRPIAVAKAARHAAVACKGHKVKLKLQNHARLACATRHNDAEYNFRPDLPYMEYIRLDWLSV
jgi:hypothetical protein